MIIDDVPVDPRLIALIERGVPWGLALEAIASTDLDRDPRARTYSVRDTDKYLDER